MAISYGKLWDLVKSNKMKKGDLARAAAITQYSMAKLNKNEPITMDVLIRICKVFHCDIGDIVEIIEDEPIERDERSYNDEY